MVMTWHLLAVTAFLLLSVTPIRADMKNDVTENGFTMIYVVLVVMVLLFVLPIAGYCIFLCVAPCIAHKNYKDQKETHVPGSPASSQSFFDYAMNGSPDPEPPATPLYGQMPHQNWMVPMPAPAAKPSTCSSPVPQNA